MCMHTYVGIVVMKSLPFLYLCYVCWKLRTYVRICISMLGIVIVFFTLVTSSTMHVDYVHMHIGIAFVTVPKLLYNISTMLVITYVCVGMFGIVTALGTLVMSYQIISITDILSFLRTSKLGLHRNGIILSANMLSYQCWPYCANLVNSEFCMYIHIQYVYSSFTNFVRYLHYYS